jgi:hypothetical protein
MATTILKTKKAKATALAFMDMDVRLLVTTLGLHS